VSDDTRDDQRDEAPVIKVTDKRRFAKVEGSGPAGTAGPEPAEGDVAAASGGRDDELAHAQEQAKEYLAHLQRLQAEFDNYRKRVLREQTSAVELAAEPVMRRLLEVLDDFDLALMHAGEDVDHERFVKGVELVYAKMIDALKAEGLERIQAEGAIFDPELHEALMQTGESDDGELRVAEVYRPGYLLRGRVIRPAGVSVERR
jgi:molecular chaperone GrpE